VQTDDKRLYSGRKEMVDSSLISKPHSHKPVSPKTSSPLRNSFIGVSMSN
jgi:hypothetical protein